MARYYEQSNANVHRGTYLIAEEATAALEGARAKVARFIGAARSREVVFTKNATEALNLVAKAWGRANLAGRRRRRAHRARAPRQHRPVAPAPRRARHRAALDPRRAPTATSTSPTSTGWSTAPRSSPSPPCRTCSARCCPSSAWSTAAHDAGAIAVVDASQHVPHVATDVQAWGADFVAFTGHKMCGPTGIGVLWGTERDPRRHARRSSPAAR